MSLFLVAIALAFAPAVFAQNQSGLFNRQSTQPAEATTLERFRIRVVWGGGDAQAWQGSLVLSDGSFENLRTLGSEPDAGAALHRVGNEVRIRPTRASEFQGFDIDVVGSRSQQITINLTSEEKGVHQKTIDLSPLANSVGSIAGLQQILDDTGNLIDINRAPGDLIPVSFDRDHLVFEPGEEFEFNLQPFRGIPESGVNAKLQLNVVATEDGRSQFDQQYTLAWDGSLYTRRQPIRLTLPDREGVYDIRLTLKDESLSGRLSLNRQKVSRTIQVVVVDRDPIVNQPQLNAEQFVMWTEVYNSEDVRNQWIDRIPGIPQFRNASSGPNNSPLKNSGVAPGIVDGKTWNQFAPGGWQAIPLQVSEPGKPHIVEIEYLDEGPMAMGISVLQPAVDGQIEPFGVDSGISIPERPGTYSTKEPEPRRHRIFFWPTNEKPYLLFANRHQTCDARIGAIRVLSGPDRLANSFAMEPASAASAAFVNQGKSKRKYMAFYEKPLFVENFSGTKAIDETGHSWHGWNAFLTAADRWTQYLKANGYNSAMLVVAGDGSAYYPSDLLQPNSRFDTGVFSPSGSNPIRKDVIELLLRIFEREGLQLVPVFHFNSPLRDLERQRLTGAPDAEGILLIDAQGESRLANLRNAVDPVSIYNPLDQRVQKAHVDLIREFVDRYGDRDSYKNIGGIGFLYSRDALQVLPGQTWGVDRTTLTSFLSDTGSEISSDPDWLAQLLDGEGRSRWLDWRTSRMANMLDDLQSTARNEQRIYLMGSDMFETQDAFSALVPSLRRNGDMTEAMARIAFPTERIANDSDLVFLQPHELAPEQSLADNRLNIQLRQTSDGQNVFSKFANSGTLFSHRYSWAEFEQLRQQKLFGQIQKQPLMRLQPLAPAGILNRQRLVQSIADNDSQTLVEGGWLTGFGQEEHLVGLIETFTQLPDVKFTEVMAGSESETQTGVVVRQTVVEDRNWFYIANPTPWKLKATVQLSGRETVIESVSGDLVFDDQSEVPQMIVELEPFSLQGGSLGKNVNVVGYQVELPDVVTSELQDRLNSLLTKVSRAAQVEPVDVLLNQGFEPVSETRDGLQQFGWNYDKRANDVVTLNYDNPLAGNASLTMVSRGTPTWIRSNEFPAPVTGRLSISVMIRTEDPSVQPPLRISIYGDDGRQVYYRYGVVGVESRHITNEWQEYAVHFDDLPLQEPGNLQVGFDLMGVGQVDIDQVRVFDRWLDAQDSRQLRYNLATAGFHLSNKQDIDRCRRILNGYWPRFLEEFFPEEQQDAVAAEESQEGTRSTNRKDEGGADSPIR